jgi:hypothetical protein
MFESFKAARTAVKIGFFVSSLTLASLGARLAAADGSPGAESAAFGISVARRAGGDLSDASLHRLMDAEAGAVFARHDPGRAPAPEADLLRLFEEGPPPRLNLSPETIAALNDAVPVSADPNPPARPFVFKGSAADRAAAVTCLTQAVYYEAGFEPEDGARAVAQVVLNRVRHPIFPKTVCGVVFQGADLKTGCQFSFACDGSMSKPPAEAALGRARRIALAALGGYVQKEVGEATHYHTRFVLPWWARSVAKVGQFGSQVFYRWPGALGLPGAFTGRYAGGEPSTIHGSPGSPPAPAAPAAMAADERIHAVLTVAAAQIAEPPATTITPPPPTVETAALRTEAPDLKVRAAAPPPAASQSFFSCTAGPCRRW